MLEWNFRLFRLLEGRPLIPLFVRNVGCFNVSHS